MRIRASAGPERAPASPVRLDGAARPSWLIHMFPLGKPTAGPGGKGSRAGADTCLCKLNPNGERMDCVGAETPSASETARVQPRGGRSSLSVCPRPPLGGRS